MIATHKTMLHGRCPIHSGWDYYSLEVRTEQFIKVEEIEVACNLVRDSSIAMTQEDILASLRAMLPLHCQLRLVGRHGQNTETVCEA